MSRELLEVGNRLIEIEVTPDMLRAGVREYGNWEAECRPEHVVWAIYVEMEKARRDSQVHATTL